MTRRILPWSILALVLCVPFRALADPAPADSSILDQLRPMFDAFSAGHYVLMGALAIILAVGLLRKFGSHQSWVYSNTGGTALALITATASAMAVLFAAPGAVFTWGVLQTALTVGVTAAGGYAVLKNLLVDPLLRPLAAKAPAWLQPVFTLIFYIFDKPDPVAAGNAAVAANPGRGVTSVTGQPTDLK